MGSRVTFRDALPLLLSLRGRLPNDTYMSVPSFDATDENNVAMFCAEIGMASMDTGMGLSFADAIYTPYRALSKHSGSYYVDPARAQAVPTIESVVKREPFKYGRNAPINMLVVRGKSSGGGGASSEAQLKKLRSLIESVCQQMAAAEKLTIHNLFLREAARSVALLLALDHGDEAAQCVLRSGLVHLARFSCRSAPDGTAAVINRKLIEHLSPDVRGLVLLGAFVDFISFELLVFAQAKQMEVGWSFERTGVKFFPFTWDSAALIAELEKHINNPFVSFMVTLHKLASLVSCGEPFRTIRVKVSRLIDEFSFDLEGTEYEKDEASKWDFTQDLWDKEFKTLKDVKPYAFARLYSRIIFNTNERPTTCAKDLETLIKLMRKEVAISRNSFNLNLLFQGGRCSILLLPLYIRLAHPYRDPTTMDATPKLGIFSRFVMHGAMPQIPFHECLDVCIKDLPKETFDKLWAGFCLLVETTALATPAAFVLAIESTMECSDIAIMYETDLAKYPNAKLAIGLIILFGMVIPFLRALQDRGFITEAEIGPYLLNLSLTYEQIHKMMCEVERLFGGDRETASKMKMMKVLSDGFRTLATLYACFDVYGSCRTNFVGVGIQDERRFPSVAGHEARYGCIGLIFPDIVCTKESYRNLATLNGATTSEEVYGYCLAILEKSEKEVKNLLLELPTANELKVEFVFRMNGFFDDELKGLMKAMQLSRLKLRQYQRDNQSPLFPFIESPGGNPEISCDDTPYFIGPILPKQNWVYNTTPSLVLRPPRK